MLTRALSREKRRRRKEFFLQRIGARGGVSRDENDVYTEASKRHYETVEKVAAMQKALSEYRLALVLFCSAEASVAKAARELALDVTEEDEEDEADDDDDGAADEVFFLNRRQEIIGATSALQAFDELAEEPLRIAAAASRDKVIRLEKKRKEAKLDYDSFKARNLEDRAKEAKRVLDLSTEACLQEFIETSKIAAEASMRSIASLLGCQAAFLDTAAQAAAARLASAQGHIATHANNGLALSALYRSRIDDQLSSSSPKRNSQDTNTISLAPDLDKLLQLIEKTHISSPPATIITTPDHATTVILTSPQQTEADTSKKKSEAEAMTTQENNTTTPMPSRPILQTKDLSPRNSTPSQQPSLQQDQHQKRLSMPQRPTSALRKPTNRTREQNDMVVALHAYTADRQNDLSFVPGDIIQVIKKKDNGWWIGRLGSNTGEFPSNYVSALPSNASFAS